MNSKHEAEVEALRVAAHGLDAGDRQPDLRARPRRPRRQLDGADQALPAAPDPGLRRRRAQHRRRPRRRRRATCSPTRRARPASATSSAAATSPSQRLFADLSPDLRRPGAAAEAARRRSPIGGAEVRERLGLPLPVSPRRDPLGVAVVDLPLDEGEARARLQAAPARGDARGRASRWQSAELGDRVGRGGGPPSDVALDARRPRAARSARGSLRR